MISIDSRHIGSVTLMELRGRMDSTSRSLMMSALEQELAKSDRQIILNLKDVEYISTSGLKMLRRLHEATGTVRIARPSDRVRDVLQMTGLDTSYGIYESETQAIHAITPIVNAHTHLEQGWLDEHRPGVAGVDFLDWLVGTVSGRTAALGDRREKTLHGAIERGIQAMIDAGTTTVGDISKTGLSIEPLIRSGLRGTIYVEMSGSTPDKAEARFDEVRALIDQWRPKAQSGLRIGLSPHTAYTIHPDWWPKILEYARKEDLPLCIHAAESPTEHEAFTKGTGALIAHLKNSGAGFKPPMKSPIAYLDEIGALALKPLLVHCVQVDNDDIRRIKASGSTVVHCPRSNLRLHCGRMPLEKFLVAGIPVYLGTDSLGSSPSLNVMDELETAVALHYEHVPVAQIEKLVHVAL